MYHSSSYFLYSIIPLLLSLYAQFKVKSAYKKYSQYATHAGLTGQQAARRMLDEHNLQSVRIEHVSGTLSDHYSPKEKVLRLSSGVYNSNSIAAVSVACHEAGHAYQHAEQYHPLALRSAIVPAVNIGSKLGLILFMAGLALSYASFGYGIAVIGLILMALTAVFSLITLPVEYNASNRAKQWLQQASIIDRDEISGVSDMLGAAALTYVAAAMQSVANILYYASRLTNTRNRRR